MHTWAFLHPHSHLDQLGPYHRVGVIARAGERGSRARNASAYLVNI